jgi:hypothetical protein
MTQALLLLLRRLVLVHCWCTQRLQRLPWRRLRPQHWRQHPERHLLLLLRPLLLHLQRRLQPQVWWVLLVLFLHHR